MAANRNVDLDRQAEIFSRYLIGKRPGDQETGLYKRFIGTPADTADPLLDFATAHPWSIGCLDGYTALLKPGSELRRRIYIMFAILEASPDHVDCFLPKKRSFLYLPVLSYHGLRAGARAAGGIILAWYARLVS